MAAVPKSFHDQSAILKVDKIMHGDKPVNGQYNSLPDVYHVLYYSGGRGGGGGGVPYERSEMMLVVLIKGVNYGFWYHLGCSGRNPNF